MCSVCFVWFSGEEGNEEEDSDGVHDEEEEDEEEEEGESEDESQDDSAPQVWSWLRPISVVSLFLFVRWQPTSAWLMSDAVNM